MRYQVKALRRGEGVTLLDLEAVTEHDAIQQAQIQGYAVLSARQAQSLAGWLPRRRSAFSLVLFSQELLALLDAGLNLVEALEALKEKEHRPDPQRVLGQLLHALYEGLPYSMALSQFPETFPALYVATVRASEKTGDLPEALQRYIGYQTQLDAVRKKIVSASIYPMLLLGAGGLVTLFLLGYVVPKFSSIYESSGRSLPWMSQLLLAWGKLLETNGTAVLLGAVAVVVAAVYGLAQPAVRRQLVRRLWQIPAVGERIRVYQLARFYRTLGMLLRGGVSIMAALEMVSGLLDPQMRGQLDDAAREIREGRALSVGMEAHGLTTPISLRMLRVGERSGRMGEMMERIAGFYDEEMARWVEWFTKLFEPILMAFIGLVIGVIVVLMYMPIFDLAGSIQ